MHLANAVTAGKPLRTVLAAIACTVALAVVALANVVSPAGAAPSVTWSPPLSVDPGGSLSAISCPSRELCVAVDKSGHAIASADPTASSPVWKSASIDPGASIDSVSCPSTGLCVAVDDAGHALLSTAPTGGAGSWSRMTIDESPSHEPRALNGVSCPTVSLCVAVDSVGNALVTASPTGGPWTAFDIAGTSSLRAVSCAGSSQCVAVDQVGEAIASASPTAGPSGWRAHTVDAALDLQAVSCVSAGPCVAVDSSGNALGSLDATDAAPTWAATPVDAVSGLTGVTCVAAGACLAVDGAGQGLASEAPAAMPPSWTVSPAEPGARLTGVSCTPDGFCMAVDANGRALTATLTLPVAEPPPPPATFVRPHPTISGVPAVGSRLLCDSGVPPGAPATLTYAWWRDGSPIAAAATAGYLVVKADAKHHLQCLVTATNAAGSATAHSAFVAIPASGVLAAADETIVGAAHVGKGRLEVPVKCSPRAARVCVIVSSITVVEGLRANRIVSLYAQRSKSSKGRQVTVTLGSSRVRMAPGQQRTIAVSLTPSARRLLAHRRRLPAQLLVAGTVIGVLDATLARQRVTFKR
jgi:hypothetical protein